jgi:shikimate kinase
MTPKIILIGPMGSGKTTIGRALAQNLGIDFRDTDEVIEKSAGRTISDIFLEDGEDEFRSLEKKALREELLKDSTVLALGGGAPVSPDAQSALRASGSYIVYLQASLSTVAPRIGFNRDRPLLLHNPRGQWQMLMEERRPIYESLARLTVDTNDLSEMDIVDLILKEFV